MNRTDYNYGNVKPDSAKSPEVLQHEVDAARERLGARLDTLSHRLSPGELLDQALATVKEHGGEFSHNLGSQVKQNPLPMILTGVGLSWLMMGSRSPQPYGQGYSVGSRPSLGDKAASAMDTAKGAMSDVAQRAREMKERAGEAGHSLHERAGEMRHSMHEHSGDMAESARWRVQSAQQQFEAFCRDQPVLAGSLGIAFGALMGSMLPSTRHEDALMGELSEEAKSRARATGAEQYDRVRDKGREMAAEAKDKVQRAAAEHSGDNRGAGSSSLSGTTSGTTAGSGAAGDYGARTPGGTPEKRPDEGESHPSSF